MTLRTPEGITAHVAQLVDWTRGVRRIYECRQCGRSVDRTTTACPECASAEIACYRIP